MMLCIFCELISSFASFVFSYIIFRTVIVSDYQHFFIIFMVAGRQLRRMRQLELHSWHDLGLMYVRFLNVSDPVSEF